MMERSTVDVTFTIPRMWLCKDSNMWLYKDSNTANWGIEQLYDTLRTALQPLGYRLDKASGHSTRLIFELYEERPVS